jgi:hypothetical protein
VDVVLRSDGVSGWTVDSQGYLTPFGGAQTVSVSASFNQNVVRRAVVYNDNSGYTLDNFGGLHPFEVDGTSPPPQANNPNYWNNWDIVRDLELLPNRTGGYLLDGYGGVHPFALGNNPEPPAPTSGPYWPNWDIARAIGLLPNGTGGYVLDGYGGVHPFALGNNPEPPAPTSGPYWPNWDIARDLVIRNDGVSGYILDGFGAVHGFTAGAGASPPQVSFHYEADQDVARSLALSNLNNNAAGYVAFLDKTQEPPWAFRP